MFVASRVTSALFPGCAAHWISTVGLLMLAPPSSSCSALQLYTVKMSHILNLYLVISSRCIGGYILISLKWEWQSCFFFFFFISYTFTHTEIFIILPNLGKQRLSSISIIMKSYLSDIWVNNGRWFLPGMYACARNQSTIKILTF